MSLLGALVLGVGLLATYSAGTLDPSFAAWMVAILTPTAVLTALVARCGGSIRPVPVILTVALTALAVVQLVVFSELTREQRRIDESLVEPLTGT